MRRPYHAGAFSKYPERVVVRAEQVRNPPKDWSTVELTLVDKLKARVGVQKYKRQQKPFSIDSVRGFGIKALKRELREARRAT